MAKLLSHPLSYALLFTFLFFLLISTEMPTAEAKLCKRKSETWFGECLNSDGCNDQCIKRESAVSGSCHGDFPGFACFCYFNC